MEKLEKYIVTQDTKSVLQTLDRNYSSSVDNQIDQYLEQLVQAISLVYPQVSSYSETDMQMSLETRVLDVLQNDPQTVCLCLDRFLLKNVEDKMSNQFTRLSINRTASGEKTARQGNQPIDQQIELIASFVKDKPLFVVDDGLFSGGTTQFVLNKLYQAGVGKDQIKSIIAFIGNSQTITENGVPVQLVKDVPDLFEWIDARDFGIFGGRQLSASRNNRVTIASPYLYPWTEGEAASLNKSGQLFAVSKQMISSFRNLISDYQTQSGKKLVFRDLLKAGFPLPTNREKNIPVSINTQVDEYLSSCLQLIEAEQQREVVVFDMDGTLYELDGENCGWSGSSLENKVLTNSLQFIQQKEDISVDQAKLVMAEGLQDVVGISRYLAKKYNVCREEYFNEAWNISPEGIVFNFETAVEVVKEISKTDKKMILLTSAPKVWQKQVIEFLGIQDCFEAIYTGEDFGQKQEIFSMLSERYQPEKITSIGDQLKTDIEPASKLGFQTLKVDNPQDLSRLISL